MTREYDYSGVFDVDNSSDRAKVEAKQREWKRANVEREVQKAADRLLEKFREQARRKGFRDTEFDIYMHQPRGFSDETWLAGYRDFDPNQPIYEKGRSLTGWQAYHQHVRILRQRMLADAGIDD